MSAFKEFEKLLSQMNRAEKAQLLGLVVRDLSGGFPGIEITTGVSGGEPLPNVTS